LLYYFHSQNYQQGENTMANIDNLGAITQRNEAGPLVSFTGYLTTEVLAFRNGQEVVAKHNEQAGSPRIDMSLIESIARKIVGELALAGIVLVGVVETVFRAAILLVVALVVLPISCCVAEKPATIPLKLATLLLIGHVCSVAVTVGALFENVRTGITGEELVFNDCFPLAAQTLWPAACEAIKLN
jgi:hypothetical protein